LNDAIHVFEKEARTLVDAGYINSDFFGDIFKSLQDLLNNLLQNQSLLSQLCYTTYVIPLISQFNSFKFKLLDYCLEISALSLKEVLSKYYHDFSLIHDVFCFHFHSVEKENQPSDAWLKQALIKHPRILLQDLGDLLNTLTLNDEKDKVLIAAFLSSTWEKLKKSKLSYTALPEHYSTELLVFIAKALHIVDTVGLT